MATYNWKYKSGSIIPLFKNNTTFVNEGADDVPPSNWVYCAIWGNDETGNGSRKYPFKTISHSVSINNHVIIGAGVYREMVIGFAPYLVADGEVILEGTGLARCVQNNSGGNNCTIVRCTLQNAITALAGGPAMFIGCKLRNGLVGYAYGCDNIFENLTINSYLTSDFGNNPANDNNTFVRCKMLNCAEFNDVVPFNTVSNIYKKCNLWLNENGAKSMSYSLFFECNVYFGSTYPTVPTVYYPSVTPGWIKIDSIEGLRNAAIAQYPNLEGAFERCLVADPLFNNEPIGDYSLGFSSPAKNLSYFGAHVGAQSIANPFKVSNNEPEGDFYFPSAINLNIDDNSLTMVNPTALASIETKVKVNFIGRELGKVPVYGFNADRNGQYISSLPDVSNSTINPGTDLMTNTPYLVDTAAITWNGYVIQPGETFTTTDIVSFTSVGGGICREIVIAPLRHTIMARFSNGGSIKTVGDTLTVGYWYYVSGTISYNGNDYTDSVFVAVNTSSFTGDGAVIEAITNQAYQHYESGIKFMSNNIGDQRSGEIVRGNGDPEFERGEGKEFPINAKFIQLKCIIQPHNLKP